MLIWQRGHGQQQQQQKRYRCRCRTETRTLPGWCSFCFILTANRANKTVVFPPKCDPNHVFICFWIGISNVRVSDPCNPMTPSQRWCPDMELIPTTLLKRVVKILKKEAVAKKAHFDVSSLISASSCGVRFKQTSLNIWVLPGCTADVH